MQRRVINRLSIGPITVALALAWGAGPVAQAQSAAPPEECDWAPEPGISFVQARLQEPPDCVMEEPTPQISQPELPGADARAVKPDCSAAAGPARNDKKVVLRKPCHELDDREMDGTCGGLTGSFDMTQSGNMVLNDNSAQSISLSGQAQQNMSSVVNITSIDSTISVMLNLNVNINSTVGTVNQGNTGTQNTGVQNALTTVHP